MERWSFDKSAQERLTDLLKIVSPTTEEVRMASYLRSEWNELGVATTADNLGNIYGSLFGAKGIDVGLVAHIDTIAIQITNILYNGMLQFRSLSIKPHVLLGQRVNISTSNGVVSGVIGFDPTSQYGQPKGLVFEDLWVDIGCTSREEALKIVEFGDFATLESHCSMVGEKNIVSSAIDNKIGVFIVSECLRWFAKVGSPLNIHVIGTVQEEIGLRGAAVVCRNQKLDSCFVVDVDYATDTPTSHNDQLGELRLGRGVGLHRKGDNNSVLRGVVVDVAKDEKIPYQISLGRYICGGTDASALQLGLNGVATVNINIPCRYMHSPVEMCNVDDVESAVNLLIATISKIADKELMSYIPEI